MTRASYVCFFCVVFFLLIFFVFLLCRVAVVSEALRYTLMLDLNSLLPCSQLASLLLCLFLSPGTQMGDIYYTELATPGKLQSRQGYFC